MSDRKTSLEAATEQVIHQQQQPQLEHVETNENKTSTFDNDIQKNEVKFSTAQNNEDLCKSIGSKKHRKRKRQYNQHHNNKNNKKWNKQFKQQQQRQNLHNNTVKLDGDNGGGGGGGGGQTNNNNNNKNLNNGRKHSYGQKSLRSIFKFVSRRHRGGVSKFFLPDKRPRKELIIPPTKFLLGGNISDPLNLNSLQDEALNASMNAATPKSSPITTPPKIDVIIPPNICDPLHLMDPVDSVEYENLLISPVKRRVKHRQRKKKPRKRHDSSMSSVPAATADCSGGENDLSVTTTDDEEKCDDGKSTSSIQKKDSNSVVDELHEGTVTATTSITDRKDLHLDLTLNSESGTRKRKTSESQTANKNKLRRLESMDKIVSPVIPQPGAWKRPPQILPMGAPKNRHRATSTSITDESNNSLELEKSATEDVDHQHQQQPMEQAQIEKQHAQETDQAAISAADVATIQHPTEEVIKHEKEEENEQNEKKPIFKKENVRYQFGNYSRYFGYKILDDFMDVRLIIFKRNSFLFKDKDILDIGCNSGHLTIAIAKKLHPKSILGIDIDENLMFTAKRNLSMYVRIPREQPKTKEPKNDDEKKKKGTNVNRRHENKKFKEHARADIENKHHPDRKRGRGNTREQRKSVYYPISFPICYGKMPRKSDIEQIGKEDDDDDDEDDILPSTIHNENDKESIFFPNNVSFKKHNYVLSDEAKLSADVPQYDLILCLSTTKWIHLNFGDAGLKLAFRRMFNQLRPGGKLILEAQNWASYKKKKNLTERIYTNYNNIEFFPNKFHEYLLSPEVGFSHSYLMGIPRHMGKGFRRPIQLYVKGDFTPSQVRWSDSYHPQTPYEPYRGYYASTTRRSRQRHGSAWNPQEHTPHSSGGRYTALFTPCQGLSTTSQYYNPLETDSYLPSYDTEVPNRHYCFQSPLYSMVWSPPAGGSSSGRRSASQTPLFGSIRRITDAEELAGTKRHVYLPSFGQESSRSVDDTSRSPQTLHVYATCSSTSVREQEPESRSPQIQHVYATTSSCNNSVREQDFESNSSPREHVYVTSCDISSSPQQQYNSGESSRSGDIETEETDGYDGGDDVQRKDFDQ